MRYKKKEIFAIIIILLISLGLAFLPNIQSYVNKDDEILEDKPNYVTITVTGEVIENDYKIKIKYGYSYGNIIRQLQLVSNDYSIIQYDSKERFYEDTTIVIPSTDTGSLIYEDDKIISINTASKEELMKIYGIGDKRSDKIIEYRVNKKISSYDELKVVLGVSDAVMEEIKKQAILQ
ncbi:MAG: helix-hairpin-helix domain-containing protein [Erysipelotrichaceae bacterium]|nr:helix-hairpin-helix domain-containing protein [Erysipelotrichaceae bacterium]